MINILMNQKQGLTAILSKLPGDGDPWAPNNLLTPDTVLKPHRTGYTHFYRRLCEMFHSSVLKSFYYLFRMTTVYPSTDLQYR